jgi:hypothetical protein
MKALTVITAITTSVTFSVCYAGTVEITTTGDRVELVAKYVFNGERFDRTVVNEGVMASISGNFPFDVFLMDGFGRKPDRLIHFDEYGYVYEFAEDDNVISDNYFPIGQSGYYLRKKYWSAIFSLYGPDLHLIAELPGEGKPNVCASSEHFALSNVTWCGRIPIEGKEDWEVPSFTVYDLSGEVVGLTFLPIGYGIAAFEKGVDRFIAVDPASIDRNEHPSTSRGTRVFDIYGRLLFTLNDDIFLDPRRDNYKRKFLYGSEKYICHVGTRSSLLTSSDNRYDTEYYDQSNAFNNLVLEVYDGEGSFLWDYEIDGTGQLNGSIFLSDNEEFLCLVIRSEAKVIVFETRSGEIVNELHFPTSFNAIFGHSVSNDGIYIALSPAPGRTVVFAGNDIIVDTLPWQKAGPFEGMLHTVLAPDSDYLIVGGPDEIHLYKIR